MEKKEEMKWIAIGLLFLMILANAARISSVSKDGDYDYCVEWEGWIQRENLVFNCYDIITDTHICNFKITEENKLLVGDIDTGEVSEYQCSRLIKTKKIGNYD